MYKQTAYFYMRLFVKISCMIGKFVTVFKYLAYGGKEWKEYSDSILVKKIIYKGGTVVKEIPVK